MDNDTFYISASLSNRYEYNTTFNVMNTPINMRCGYNIRNKKRWVILTDNYDYIILTQTFISEGRKCELNFNANQSNISGYLTLVKKDNSNRIPTNYDYANWANDFEILFVTNTQEKEHEWDKNYLSVMVGGG